MPEIHLHQIYYDELTRATLDPGFIPLDNRGNERPDWREYHPIRRFLLSQELRASDFYGFFSPRFSFKTALAAEQVKAFVAGHAAADVVLFSPEFDQSAFFRNVFEQGEYHHPGLTRASQDFVRSVGLDVDLSEMVTDSSDTVFANYIVARPQFWQEWLRLGEQLYAHCEASAAGTSALTTRTIYSGDVQLKVFLMERLATLLLAMAPGIGTIAYDASALPMSGTPLARFRQEAVTCDTLKIAFRRSHEPGHLDEFYAVRDRVFAKARSWKSMFPILARGRPHHLKVFPAVRPR
jgi:hypothetical protein